MAGALQSSNTGPSPVSPPWPSQRPAQSSFAENLGDDDNFWDEMDAEVTDKHSEQSSSAPQHDGTRSKAKANSWTSTFSSFSKGVKKYGALAKRALADEVQEATDG